MLNNSPLDNLIATANLGQHDQLQERIIEFRAYANNLSELSRLACTLASTSSQPAWHQEGIHMVQVARKNLEILVPYVINAAQILCTFGEKASREACENMQVIRSRWISQVDMLQLAIDDITSINDFMGTYSSVNKYHVDSLIGFFILLKQSTNIIFIVT